MTLHGLRMQTKHLCVLIHIWTKGEVAVRWNRFKPSSKILLLTVPRRYFFCGSFVLFMTCVCHAFVSVHCCLVVTWRERADLGTCLWCLLWFCYFPIWYPVTGVVLDCNNSWALLSFLLCTFWMMLMNRHENQLWRHKRHFEELINHRIPGDRLLISSIPGWASWMHVLSLGKPRNSTSILEALPSKLDIKRRSASILYFHWNCSTPYEAMQKMIEYSCFTTNSTHVFSGGSQSDGRTMSLVLLLLLAGCWQGKDFVNTLQSLYNTPYYNTACVTLMVHNSWFEKVNISRHSFKSNK